MQSKYIGTGHADTSKFEWLLNQHRDTYASIIGMASPVMRELRTRLICICVYKGHPGLLDYIALAENESKEMVRFKLLKKCLQPCGHPPQKAEME